MQRRTLHVVVVLSFISFFLAGGMLAAQNGDDNGVEGDADEVPSGPSGPARPEDTDIVLPSEILEVEDIDLEVVDAPLPEFREPPLPDLAIPLPGPEELAITQAALDIDPGAPGAATRTGDARDEERSLYSTGRVAVGSRNYLAGDIGIFSFGSDPEFNLEYSHEGIDGYADNEPGTGYFRRRDRISGQLDSGLGPIGLSASGSFEERDDGLQRQSEDFYSVDQRYISGGTSLEWQSDGAFVARAGSEVSSATRLFVTDQGEPVTENALEVLGDVEAALEFERGEVAVVGDYRSRQSSADSFNHVFGGGIRGEYAFTMPLVIDAGAGVSWRPEEAPVFPLEAGISGTIEDVLTLELRGGTRALRPSFYEVWREVPTAGLPDVALEDGREWFGRTSANWLATPTVTVDAAAEFQFSQNAIDYEGFSPVESRYPVLQRDITQLRSELSTTWSPSRIFRVTGGYVGRFVDRRAIEPLHEANAEVEINEVEDRAGGRIGVVMPVFDEPALPEMTVSGFARLAEGIEVGLEFNDILDPVRDVPRARIGATRSDDHPFIEPGVRATVFARLSL